MADENYENITAKWNADDMQLFNLFEIKTKILDLINTREFEALYWEIRKFWIELDAKMTPNEREDYENSMKVLDNIRVSLFQSDKRNKSELEINFYILLTNFYRDLCRMMKNHGLYYREAEDDRGL